MRKPALPVVDNQGQHQFNQDVLRFIEVLRGLPFLDGNRLTVSVGVTDTLVQHRLGRVPQGFWIINPNADTVVWQPAAPDAVNIHLQAGTAITVDVWVF